MKTLRQLLVASVVTFALVTPAFAGQMDTTVAPPVNAVTTDGEISTTSAGEIQTGNSEPTAGDTVTAAALCLIESVLALF
jgi:hypothetical protein